MSIWLLAEHPERILDESAQELKGREKEEEEEKYTYREDWAHSQLDWLSRAEEEEMRPFSIRNEILPYQTYSIHIYSQWP